MKLNLSFSLLTLGVFFGLGAARAQDKIHLKEPYAFKDGKTTLYEGSSGEAFRLRAIGKKSLTVELPGAALAEVPAAMVSEAPGVLVAARDCHLNSEVWGAANPDKEESKATYIQPVKAGDILEVAQIQRHIFKVKSSQGNIGYADPACLRPQLMNIVTSWRRDVYLHPDLQGAKAAAEGGHMAKSDAQKKALKIPSGGKMIALEVSGEYTKLRDADGNEGWVRSIEVMPEDFMPKGFYRVLWKLSNWSGTGFFPGLIGFLLYLAMLFAFFFLPALASYQLVHVKLLPNWLCKLMIVVLTFIPYCIIGFKMLDLPPMDHNVYWQVGGGFFMLGSGLLCWTLFRRHVTNERCPECHAVGDYEVIDSDTQQYKETTTTTYGDGSKTKKHRYYSVTTYLKQCNQCNTTWWAGN